MMAGAIGHRHDELIGVAGAERGSVQRPTACDCVLAGVALRHSGRGYVPTRCPTGSMTGWEQRRSRLSLSQSEHVNSVAVAVRVLSAGVRGDSGVLRSWATSVLGRARGCTGPRAVAR